MKAVGTQAASRGAKRIGACIATLAVLVLLVFPAARADAGPTTIPCSNAALSQAFATGGSYAYGANCSLTISTQLTLAAGTDLSLNSGGYTVSFSGPNPFFTATEHGFAKIDGTLSLTGVSVSSFFTGGAGFAGTAGSDGVNGANGTDGGPGVAGTDGAPGGKGGDGGPGQIALGGALFIDPSGHVTLTHDTFSSDQAEGGYGGRGGAGGSGGNGGSGGSGVSAATSGAGGGAGGDGGDGGAGAESGSGGAGADGDGGAIYNEGSLTIDSSTFSGDEAVGGTSQGNYAGGGGDGGVGGGGGAGFQGGQGSVGGNGGAGGNGGTNGTGGPAGRGGSAHGGAIYNTGSLQVADATFTNNGAFAGEGSGGEGGGAYEYVGTGGNGGNPGPGTPGTATGGAPGSGADGGNGGAVGPGSSAIGGAIYSTTPFTLDGGSTSGNQVSGPTAIASSQGRGNFGGAGGYGQNPYRVGTHGANGNPDPQTGDLASVYVTGSYPTFYPNPNGRLVSGHVYEQSCGAGCSRKGQQGVTVLVTGMDSSGTAVSENDVTGADGSWSVTVPNGTYEAGPSQDGKTFGGLGYDPASVPNIKVNGASMGGVNFTTCAAGGSSQSAARDVGMARGASASTAVVGPCTSIYTVRLGGVITQKQLVDPGEGARYNTNEDGNPDYRDSSGAWNAFSHSFPFMVSGGHRQYPSCPTDFPDSEVSRLEKKGWTGSDIRWYSYIKGPARLSPVTVKFAYNQSTGQVSLQGDPVNELAEAEVTKVWKWVEYGRFGFFSGAVNYGTCEEKKEIPALVFPVPEKRGFTVVVAWGFPFSGTGAQALLKLDKAEFEEAVEKAGAAGDQHIATYWEQARYDGKFALLLALETWGVGKATKLLELGAEHTAVKKVVGELVSKSAGSFAGVAERAHQGKDITEVTEWLNAFSNESGYMMAVIRGKFEPVFSLHGKLSSHGAHAATILALSYATTKFPNITLSINRRAFAYRDDRYPPFSGTLPWANSSLGTGRPASPAVNNPLARNPRGYLAVNDEDYASGTEALEKLREATNESLSQVAYSINTHGNLAWNFENEQNAAGVGPPNCAETLPGYVISAGDDANTICWRFNDGDA